jgi:transitional endoplasmic reticulum ATPase
MVGEHFWDFGDDLTDLEAAPSEVAIYLRVTEALPEDVDRGVARLDPRALDALGLAAGQVVSITGRRTTLARVAASGSGTGGQIRLDGIQRDNARTGLDGRVAVARVELATAGYVELTPTRADSDGEHDLTDIHAALLGRALTDDDALNLAGQLRARVQRVEPNGRGLVTPSTRIELGFAPSPIEIEPQAQARLRYEDLGGLHDELRRVRELVELPLKYPTLFERLGVEPPRGVLLHGPPGTGKTLIARAVASEVSAHFVVLNGPEVINKWYGESEARLRDIFDEAQRKAPSIIFIDEIDAVAPRRANVAGEMEKRVVAQLLTLMDGLVGRGKVVVIGATNMPDLVDPALRRPGRFDREIAVPVPNRASRGEILRVHSRHMPLGDDVDLERLADATHGFVGADLAVLCKEAGMLALHDVLEQAGFETADANALAADARVRMRHFLGALRGIEPTAIREIFVEKPNVTWADVGGLHEVRDFLEAAVVLPRRSPEVFRRAGIRPPTGIVLSGPSGTGKSLVARALAHESALSFLSVDPAMLFSKWLGESEKMLHQVFVKARQAAPCLVLFDQLDALATARGQGPAGAAPDRLLGQLVGELDNLDALSDVVVLAATNRLDLVDAALLSAGRLGYVIDFPLPDEADRRAILEIHAARLVVAEDVDLDTLARDSQGLSGAQLAAACQHAALSELRAHAPDAWGDVRVPHARFVEALEAAQRRHP